MTVPTDLRSLQGRLVLRVVGVVALVWLIVAILTWVDVRNELDELLDSHLAQAASLLVMQQIRAVEDDDHEIDAPALHRYAPKVAFQVFHRGLLLLRSANAPVRPMIDSAQPFRSGLKTVSIDNRVWRVFAAYGAENDMQVYVGERAQSRAAILRAVLRSTLAPMLIALPILALVAWLAIRQSLTPLRELGRMLRERQPQSVSPVALQHAPSEMTPMLEALNGLLARMAVLMESERRFNADAAHELRTPIAAIRAQAQVALGESDPLLQHPALLATLAGCDRATRLVEQLLMLSRVESGTVASLTALDLTALARKVVAELAHAAIDKSQTIALEAAADSVVHGNPELLSALARNLVDNAIRYCPTCANIQIAVRQTAQGVVLDVEDDGPGLSEQDTARLGERFFRVLGNGQTGSGLGWSISQRIAKVHGATVQVGRSARLGGFAVSLCFPPVAGAGLKPPGRS